MTIRIAELAEAMPLPTPGRYTLAIVIDVLRASTSMCYALHHGAQRIVMGADIDHARTLYKDLDGNSPSYLCGEAHAVRPDGFHFGNSPLEWSKHSLNRPAFDGATLVWATTNGTSAAHRFRGASVLMIGSYANFRSVLNIAYQRAAVEPDSHIVLVPAGTNGRPSSEDEYCAAQFLRAFASLENAYRPGQNKYQPPYSDPDLGLTQEDVSISIQSSEHAQTLRELGFADDLDAASRIDYTSVVPAATNQRLELKNIAGKTR